MTTNLLSVIEQQQKALKLCRNWFIDELGFTGRHPIVSYANAAIAAAQQSLEQTQGEIDALRQALVYVAHASHVTPLHMLPKGVMLCDGDGVVVRVPNGPEVWGGNVSDYEKRKLPTHPQATEPQARGDVDNPHNVDKPNEQADYGHDNSVSFGFQTPYYCAKCNEHIGDTDLPKNVPLRRYAVCYGCQEKATHPQATEPISEYCEHGIRWDTVCRSCDELPAAAMPVGELTDEQISEIWESHVIPVFGRNGINPIVFARKLLAAASTQPVREPLTDDEAFNLCRSASNRIDVLRKTEAAHGIK